MLPLTMASFGVLFFLIYIGCILGIIIYLLRLMGRFVSSHERIAKSLETIAKKLPEDTKPPVIP